MRFFNTAGPVKSTIHYCLPPLERLDLPEILRLIEQEKYFVLHAPRQTGKTSCLLALMDYLNQEGNYRCLYFNVEMAQSDREDVSRGMRTILGRIASQARDFLQDPFIDNIWFDLLNKYGGSGALEEVLRRWAQASPKPLILLIDEIDALIGDTLISVLRQIRAGYPQRPALFPQSIVLCGVRDVRDYRIHSDRDKAIITGGSAFNIKAKSLRLGNFAQAEVKALYTQHTRETGQRFDPAALNLMWELTRGQPWLVNALAYETCFEMKTGRERSQPITAEMVIEAKENLISRRETHLDQLADKLEEERVRHVIEPILVGGEKITARLPKDDVQYVEDLGLITTKGQLRIANLIYQEVIPRELTYTTQLTISQEPSWYIRPQDGRLDMNKLFFAFQEFFREHSEHWVERFEYKEAGPQLLLQAFLQRIVNSGGRIEREYGLGKMRTDLLIVWPCPLGVQKIVIELKVLHKSLEATVGAGLKQTWEYMDRCGAQEGHLVIFDRRADMRWEEKIFQRTEGFQGEKIMVWGM
ncbi:AAA-like domain-containing protein [bacterium]|nr:AAA-like domain-containing protein [bacterium]MBU1614528.1 AAA-like domain-containing protein [bacterium]